MVLRLITISKRVSMLCRVHNWWTARTSRAVSPCFELAQCPESRSDIFNEQLRLFPGREVSAFIVLVVIDQFGISLLCPAPRRWIEFIRKDAHGNRDRDDAFDSEERGQLVLPIQTRAGNRGVGQPRDRDIVEDIVAREALGLAIKDARDHLIAA